MTAELTHMPLTELRATRAGLQHEDDAVSYVRRVAQARLDLVLDERRRRLGGGGDRLVVGDDLTRVLGSHLTSGGVARPPRPADDFSDHPLAIELDALCAEAGSTDLHSLTDGQLDAFAERLAAFEQQRSQERRDLFTRIDALSAELVRRYRDGEAHVDGLLADD